MILVPFMLVGAWRRRRSRDFGPFLAYAAILFAFTALISAVHVPGGTFIHSAIALAPHTYVLALEGVAATVGLDRGPPAALGRGDGRAHLHDGRRRLRARGRGRRLALDAGHLVRAPGRLPGRCGRALDAAGAPITDRVMSIDASGTRYWTGRGGVVLVNDPLETVEQVARAYEIRWLVLNRADGVPAVAPILDGDAAGLGRRPDPRGGAARPRRRASTSRCTRSARQADDARCAGATP